MYGYWGLFADWVILESEMSFIQTHYVGGLIFFMSKKKRGCCNLLKINPFSKIHQLPF